MKYFIDTEFLEGKQTKYILDIPYGKTPHTIDLISIGITTEDEKVNYYAVSKDFNLKEAWNSYQIEYSLGESPIEKIKIKKYWIREKVLMPIFFDLALIDFHMTHYKDEWIYKGEKVTIELFIKIWGNNLKWFKKLLSKYGKTNKEIADEIREFMYSNNPGYPACIPIEFYGYYSAYDWVVFCQLFGKMIDLPEGFPMYCKDLKQILDNYPKEIKKDKDYPSQTNEHNALDDAKWNARLYKFLMNYKK